MRDRDAGFTLIEMIVVLVVLSLAAGLVLARGPMRSATLDLRASARTMAAEIRSTRARAIDQDRTLSFVLDAVHDDYGLAGGARHALPKGVMVVPPAAPILFRPDGSSGGGTLTLGTQGRTVSVVVDWLTGAVAVR
jgi:general secretion pathway protein H